MRAVENLIVAALPRSDRVRLLAAGERVQLAGAQVLAEQGEVTRHVYFPTESYISLVAKIDHHPGLEVAMIGREGMVGGHLALGPGREPHDSFVQGAGAAWRVGARPFRSELARSSALRQVIGHYLHVLLVQRATAAGCLRYHEICPRLARWLLMRHDRAHMDHFAVTQMFMAQMLGVRRVGVTRAASALQRLGLIAYHRGEMNVVNRPGLERAACSCYAADSGFYGQVMR
jgi:CRP-like cAMP-binding protein